MGGEDIGIVDRLGDEIQREEIAEAREILGHLMLAGEADAEHIQAIIRIGECADELCKIGREHLGFARDQLRAIL